MAAATAGSPQVNYHEFVLFTGREDEGSFSVTCDYMCLNTLSFSVRFY